MGKRRCQLPPLPGAVPVGLVREYAKDARGFPPRGAGLTLQVRDDRLLEADVAALRTTGAAGAAQHGLAYPPCPAPAPEAAAALGPERRPAGAAPRTFPTGGDLETGAVNPRRLNALVLAALAGCAGFCLMAVLAWVLYQRVFQDSIGAFVVMGLIFGVGGLYGGWLLSMVVFSALSGAEREDESAR